MEQIDPNILEIPQTYFLKGEGAVLLAIKEDEVVGTVALQPFGHGVFELAKMIVVESTRGLKIGEILGQAALEQCPGIWARKSILFVEYQSLSNHQLVF